MKQLITPIEYFQRIPAEYIPDKEGLIKAREEQMAAQQAAQAAQGQAMAAAPQITPDAIMGGLSPEDQQYIQEHPEVLERAQQFMQGGATGA
jgi:hypothetical protein